MPEPTATINSSSSNAQRLTRAKNTEENPNVILSRDANLTNRSTDYVYIYNVSSMAFDVERNWVPGLTRGARRVVIPACKEGEPYSVPYRIPMVVQGRVERPGSFEIDVRGLDGKDLAQDAINPDNPRGNWQTEQPMDQSRMMNEGTNLYVWGVWWSLSNPPTQEEVTHARERMEATYNKMIEEANALSLMGDKGLSQIKRESRIAANYFGIETEWNRRFQKKVQCPGCGDSIPPGLAAHGEKCYVFDWPRAIAGGLRTKAQAIAAGVMAPEEPAITEDLQINKPHKARR